MITQKFKENVEKGLGGVVILAGSDSDAAHIDKLTTSFRKYEIPFEVRIASAHKQGEKLLQLIGEYDALNGPIVYIAVAGGTDALSGTSSHVSVRPTISCPPDGLNMSCLTNPPGSSNAFIQRPENAARFVAQMFSYVNPKCREVIACERTNKISGLEKADEEFRDRYAGGQK